MKVGSRDNGKTKPADSTCWRIRSKCSPNSGLLAKESLQVWLHVLPWGEGTCPLRRFGGPGKEPPLIKERSKSQELPPPSPLPDQPQAQAPLTVSASCSLLLTAPEEVVGRKPPVSQTAHTSINVAKHTQRRPQGHSMKKKNRLCGLQLIHPLGNDILAHLCGRFCAA